MIVTAIILSLVALFLATTALISSTPRLRHCALSGARIAYSHPRCAFTVAHWIARCVCWFLYDRLARREPTRCERIIALDPERLAALVADGSIHALQAYVDAQLPFERYLARVAMDNAERFKIRRMPRLFTGRGLVNGPYVIPAGTIVAIYYAVLSQLDLQDEDSAYRMSYGHVPANISTLKFALDGKQRLHICPDSNGSFIDHRCYHTNAEFRWMGDPCIYLTVVTRRPVEPFEQITISYGKNYLFFKTKADRLRAKNTKVCACMCDAPNPCPLRRSMLA